MSEAYEAVGTGFAYAVTLRGGARPQRFHDPEAIDKVLERWVKAGVGDVDGPGCLLHFSGCSDGDAESPATYAGAVHPGDVSAIRYWSPHDELPGEQAQEAAAALLQAQLAGLGLATEPEGEADDAPAPRSLKLR